MVESYIGLGSNLGDREAMIRRAVDRVGAIAGVHRVVCSSLYRSEPWGFSAQPAFVNAVARVTTGLGPLQLLLALKAVERDLGRTPTFHWGPREIDLDLLLYGNLQIDRRGLVVPHVSMHERAFVLAPLRELWPRYRCPDGLAIDEVLTPLLRVQPIVRLDRLDEGDGAGVETSAGPPPGASN
ncbi:MAG TPA: 2-amino-4-hydroxy-6-hydroxymethyldihydropteridine diphosphokinase [Chloroflexota bacterium]|nr:2-amino-4-hydroxy-6-hydroxymethyldihydropteridine diphosphokinase [Chloroflexota bacterium]